MSHPTRIEGKHKPYVVCSLTSLSLFNPADRDKAMQYGYYAAWAGTIIHREYFRRNKCIANAHQCCNCNILCLTGRGSVKKGILYQKGFFFNGNVGRDFGSPSNYNVEKAKGAFSSK